VEFRLPDLDGSRPSSLSGASCCLHIGEDFFRRIHPDSSAWLYADVGSPGLAQNLAHHCSAVCVCCCWSLLCGCIVHASAFLLVFFKLYSVILICSLNHGHIVQLVEHPICIRKVQVSITRVSNFCFLFALWAAGGFIVRWI
jgi:hypothetical protein